MSSTVVIIPALNEARSVGAVIDDVRANAADVDVVVIDDGSTDTTAAVARAHGADVVEHPYNLGYGVALKTGYRYAVRHGYRALVQFDADGQHCGESVPALLEPIRRGEADAVLGSRFFAGSTYRMSPLRRVGSAWFGVLLRWLTGWRVSDPTSGLQALSRPVVELYATDCFPGDYPDADMLVLLRRNGFRLREVAAAMRSDGGSPSMHGGLKTVYYVYKMTLSMLMNTVRPAHGSRPPREEAT